MRWPAARQASLSQTACRPRWGSKSVRVSAAGAAGLAGLPEQPGDEVDRACDDDDAEHIGQDGVGKHRTPDLGVAQRGVGYLVAHADGEGDVGEVAVAGMLLAVLGAERDAA